MQNPLIWQAWQLKAKPLCEGMAAVEQFRCASAYRYANLHQLFKP